MHVRRCHCTSCRKESGSAFAVYAHWPIDAFELHGEVSSYDGRGFCPRCGSRLLDTSDPDGIHIEIRLGSLDDAPFGLTLTEWPSFVSVENPPTGRRGCRSGRGG